jgi:hypothetical protein
VRFSKITYGQHNQLIAQSGRSLFLEANNPLCEDARRTDSYNVDVVQQICCILSATPENSPIIGLHVNHLAEYKQ